MKPAPGDRPSTHRPRAERPTQKNHRGSSRPFGMPRIFAAMVLSGHCFPPFSFLLIGKNNNASNLRYAAVSLGFEWPAIPGLTTYMAVPAQSSVGAADQVHQFGDLAAMIGLVAGGDRMLDAMGDVGAQDFSSTRAVRLRRGRYASPRRFAIAVASTCPASPDWPSIRCSLYSRRS